MYIEVINLKIHFLFTGLATNVHYTMKERARKDISIENIISKSRCEEKKRVGSAVQGNFCWVGRVRPTTDFFFLALRSVCSKTFRPGSI